MAQRSELVAALLAQQERAREAETRRLQAEANAPKKGGGINPMAMMRMQQQMAGGGASSAAGGGGGLAGGAGVAEGVTAGMAPLGGLGSSAGSYASTMPLSLGGQVGGTIGGSQIAGGAPLGAMAMPAAVLLAGLTMMPENENMPHDLRYNQQHGIDTPQEVTDGINALTSDTHGFDTYNQYIDSKRPPMSPYDAEVQAMQNSGVGDQEYEMEQINNMYNSGAGLQRMNDYYAANPDWYTPEGDRIYQHQDDVDAMNYFNTDPAYSLNPSISRLNPLGGWVNPVGKILGKIF
jgi:hypothetical protein